MRLLYHNELKPGDIVSIFTDYHQEKPNTYEGEATLIEKDCDLHSFSLYNEKLLTREEDRAIHPLTSKHLPLTREQTNNNKKWERIHSFFEDAPTKEIKLIRDKLRKKVSRDDKSLIDFRATLRTLRFKHVDDVSRIGFFFELYDDETLLRYFHQKYQRIWSPTIYREERWLVEFIPNQYSIASQLCTYGDGEPFRTYRKIRTIACVCPSEDIQYCEIHRHFTGNETISNDDRRIMRLRMKDDADTDTDTDVDEDEDDLPPHSLVDDEDDDDDEPDYATIPLDESNITDYDRTIDSGFGDYF
jgi:hypothetical protein